ncbi:hypothetical protein EON77_15240, partial [bacterium]
MVQGLHHLTALAGDPQQNLDFYTGKLGLRLIKTTVNFDDPSVYHLYFGDGAGTPGTVITSFPYGRALPGTRGAGEASAVTLLVPEGTLDRWATRLPEATEATSFGKRQLRLLDPDGMEIRLEEAPERIRVEWPGMPIPPEEAIIRMGTIELTPARARAVGRYADTGALLERLGASESAREGNIVRYALGDAFVDVVEDASLPPLRQSAGSVHHIAFRLAGDAEQAEAMQALHAEGVATTPVRDRDYFHSIYFREPGCVLYELATETPGFATDETFETLGSALRLPAQHEPRRAAIEAHLPPLQ